MTDKPNILLITFDTLGYDLIFGKHNQHIKTPNMHKLAKEGVNFTKCYSSSPVCTPCRTSILTGTYPQVHLMYENGITREDTLPVFTDMLKEQGYYNIMIGKTHFGPIPNSFDDCLLMRGQQGGSYQQFLEENELTSEEIASKHKPKKFHLDTFLTESTIAKMDTASKSDSPFFAFCSLFKPHGPMDTPLEYLHMYDDLPHNPINVKEDYLEQLPPRLRRILGLPVDGELLDESTAGTRYSKEMEDKIYEEMKLYYGLISYCDDLLGKLLDYLDQSDLRKNTLIIFTSDHGVQMFNHGFNDKHTFYDESFRVPLILSQPGTLPCGETREMAGSVDVTASILGAAHTSCNTMSGFDLYTPLIKGYENPRKAATSVLLGYSALVTPKYKLSYYLDDMTGTLFDMEQDEYENNNLFFDENYKEIVDAMTKALLAWHASVINLHYFKKNSFGGGPVGMRAQNIIHKMTGLDSELMLETMLKKQKII